MNSKTQPRWKERNNQGILREWTLNFTINKNKFYYTIKKLPGVKIQYSVSVSVREKYYVNDYRNIHIGFYKTLNNAKKYAYRWTDKMGILFNNAYEITSEARFSND